MVETLRDLDLSHAIREFAQEHILETVDGRYSVSPVVSASPEVMEEDPHP